MSAQAARRTLHITLPTKEAAAWTAGLSRLISEAARLPGGAPIYCNCNLTVT